MQDIHTHLYWGSYDTDRDAVLARARAAGVTAMIVVGTSEEENTKALALASAEEDMFASVGVHPNEFRSEVPAGWLETLTAQAEGNKVVAIGECGLDYSESHGAITEIQKEWQKKAFIKQIKLATKLHFPLIVHCRSTNADTDDAYWDVLAILKESAQNVTAIVLHCYMGSVAVTREFLVIPNVYFSFTGNITFPVKQAVKGGNFDLTESVKLIPLTKIFTETDCPFLAPQEQRGKRNEPAFVVAVVKKISELHEVSATDVSRSTQANFYKVFQTIQG